MYRQGLGDCFLISLPRKGGGELFHVLIDCGVLLGTPGAEDKMTEVVKNIVEVTKDDPNSASKGKIDLLVVTHEHWDHVSGFVQAQTCFQKDLEVKELWLAWTEDPHDALANKLRAEKDHALAALRMPLSRLALADPAVAEDMNGLLGFFGASRGASTEDALGIAKGLTSNIRYCLPTDDPVSIAEAGVAVYVLGPPHDEKQLKKINPSTRDKETYGLTLDEIELFLDGPKTALTSDADDCDRPFHSQFDIPIALAREMDFFRTRYFDNGSTDQAWRRIDGAWLQGATDLALQLDNLTNNTSLVLAFELTGGDVLLFAADAQVGNWLSWQDLSWTMGVRTVTGPDLLKRAIFYKVGHHASHNATLKAKGLELMTNLRVAMIPVDEKMADKKRWTMPFPNLAESLEEAVRPRGGAVVRADQPAPATQERIETNDLYYELTL